jgi:hypothetical protein
VQDLANCLKIIAGDHTVCLVRIKNRLDLLYDAGQSAGYRNLALNLSLATEWSCSLGLEKHVCEVQLILQSFAELKVIVNKNVVVFPVSQSFWCLLVVS